MNFERDFDAEFNAILGVSQVEIASQKYSEESSQIIGVILLFVFGHFVFYQELNTLLYIGVVVIPLVGFLGLQKRDRQRMDEIQQIKTDRKI